MILRFRHKGLERLFTSGETRGVNAQYAQRVRRMLLVLNNSKTPQGMNMPGFRLHPLKGELQGYWAVSVSGNWRLIFRFEDENATDVDLIDYH